MKSTTFVTGYFLLVAVLIKNVQPTCVLESDFGFKINCAFKKSGLFRVRNLGGIKAHASLGFSLGDELGFEQSLTNQDPSRRRSVSVKNGAPPNILVDPSRTSNKQEKRGKQNRIMMRPVVSTPARPNQAAMDRLSSLHRRVSSTMHPIIVPPSIEPTASRMPAITMAKPMPMGVPPFRPLPPKEDTLKVLPITSPTRKNYTPLRIPDSKGPGIAYQSEIYPQSQNQIANMVSQMTAVQYAHPILRITPSPIVIHPAPFNAPNSINQFVPMPIASPPTQTLTIIHPPAFKDLPKIYTQSMSVQNTNPVSNFVDPVPHQVHNIASNYAYNTKKVDDYNSITGYGDDTVLKLDKDEINAKIADIAKAGNISMEAVEAAISLRQQQLLNKYANIPPPTTTSTTTSTTQSPIVFEPEPEILVTAIPKKPQRLPSSGKVMNAPKEYYPVGYEKDFDDHFQTKVDLPDTNFHCGDQKYFPGLYGDESLGCMVFHVCALTDDGLVMKSFLCPESTLFDQTILKCNWWFYVDCKNTKKLYDTNIPVSKSYQLMKALTFFSSYKKEMQDDARPANPEDVDGIKEAISILESPNPSKFSSDLPNNNVPNAIQIITPQPLIDERNNQKVEYSTEPSPVYRANRNLNNIGAININNMSSTHETISEYKLIKVNADLNFSKDNSSNYAQINNTSTEKDRKHRRRLTLKFSNTTQETTTIQPSTTDTPIQVTTPSIEIIKQEIQPIEHFSEVRQEKLTDQLDAVKEMDNFNPVRRFYRSSAEKINEKNEVEMAVVNNEMVQIVRPTATSKLVGQNPTQRAAIDKLDAAVLRQPVLRFKKEAITYVTPQRQHHRSRINNPT